MSTANENKVTFENIKQLSATSQNEIPELVKNVKEAKRQIDSILKQLKDKENEFLAIKAENESKQNIIETTAQAKKAEELLLKPAEKTEAEKINIKVLETDLPKETTETLVENVKKAPAEEIEKISEPVKITHSKKTAKTEEAEKAEPVAVSHPKKTVKSVDDTISEEVKATVVSEEKIPLVADSVPVSENIAVTENIQEKENALTAKNKEVKPRKAKTAEEKFLDSLPKPVNQENKRIINILPEKPKAEIKRYTSPERYDNRPQRPRPMQGGEGGNGYQPNNNYQPSPRYQGTSNQGAPYQGTPYQGNRQGTPYQGNRPGTPYQGNTYQGGNKNFQGGNNNFRPSNAPYTPFKKPALNTNYPPIVPVVDTSGKNAVKKKTDKNFEADKKDKVMNKYTLIKRGFETDITLTGDDEYKMGSKKFKIKKKEPVIVQPMPKIEKAIVNTELIPIKILSDKLGITAVDITKKLFKDGIIKTINETLDFETAALMAVDFGIELELKLDKTAEDTLVESHEIEDQNDPNMIKRPPIVTVMGHVDHGKTSLLDAIKHTNVAGGEAGGITQQIGAYTIKAKGEMITFIDTPGHEAFTAMRARGASITDIAILVVAADDGIMPQTIEAINHAKAANVPIIVAINKMDKPTANPDKIKQQLTEHGIVPEEWGGEAIICPVSAIKGDGIDHLLEMILLVADVKELKANPNRKARGTVIEAQLDKGKGPVASILIQNGTLFVGDTVVAGTTSGRIRAMIDDKGRNIKEAGPSTAVSVLGFSEVPNAGDPVFSMDNEKLSRLVAQERLNKIKTDMTNVATKITLDDVFDKIAQGQIKGLNVIIKADLQGSVEAVSQALLKLSNSEVKVTIVHSGVGAINESDVTLAQTVSAIIIGFSVRPEIKAKQLAERENVDIRLYRIIYDVTDDVEKALKGMLAPKFKEVQLGQAEVRNVFKITGAGTIAGSYVTSGKILRNSKIRLLRDNVVITDGQISSLKRFKDDVKEVAQGYECGISIEDFNDIKENDIIECYQMEEIPQ